MQHLPKVDPEIASLIELEGKRQSETLMMIPSENIASVAVEEAVGSSLGNKYAEGYPGRRYYQGQAYVDQVENLCIERAKKVFGVPFANVQPHSGSPANFAVLNALLAPGDTYMGLALSSGGHLTHGAKLNASSKYFNAVQYEVKEDGWLDYEAIAKLAHECKPKLIIAGTTAYSRLLDWEQFAKIADSVGAWLMTDVAHVAGLIAGGAYPSPANFAHVITTTTHKSLRGPRGAMIMVTQKGLDRDPELGKKINSSIIPGVQGGPHINSIAGIAVALKETELPGFKPYAAAVMKNAKTLAAELTSAGFPIVTGGTDSHMFLVDIRPYEISGKTMAEACEAAGIVLNYNTVPHDPAPPFYPSGIRLGTPALTSRGMGEIEMKQIASWFTQIAKEVSETKKRLGMTAELERKAEGRRQIIEEASVLPKIAKEVKELCSKFPIPAEYK